MGYPILIVGGTGTGKSTSLRNLPRANTAILNAELKPLPFRNTKFKLGADITQTAQMIEAMKRLETMKDIKFVVLDSMTMYAAGPVYREIVDGVDGFEGWSNYKKHLISIVDRMKTSQKQYIVTALEERAGDHLDAKICSAAVQGSLKGGGLESHFSIVFRSMKVDDMNSPNGVSYKFATNQIPNERISAKSPMEMFEDLYIDNDVVEIYKKIFDYYK